MRKLSRLLTVAGFAVNYDESLVGTYTLPDPLVLSNARASTRAGTDGDDPRLNDPVGLTVGRGKKVTDAKTWNNLRRPEILKLFEEQQFGKMPPRPSEMSFHVFDKGTTAYSGKAVRKQVTIYFTKDTSKHKMDLLIYLPAHAKGPSPLLLQHGLTGTS